MVVASGLLWLVAGVWQIAPHNYPRPRASGSSIRCRGSSCSSSAWPALMHVRRGGEILLPAGRWRWDAAAYLVRRAALGERIPLWGMEDRLGSAGRPGRLRQDVPLGCRGCCMSWRSPISSSPYQRLPNLARTASRHPLASARQAFAAGLHRRHAAAMGAQVIKTVTPPALRWTAS